MSTGSYGEDLACNFLVKKGYQILTRNYHSRFGEIDIIAKDKGCIVFVEVKTRTNNLFGSPGEAITNKKISKMIKTLQFYLFEHKQGAADFRIDAIEIMVKNNKMEIVHSENITS